MGTGDIFGPAFESRRLLLRTLEDYVALYGSRGLEFEPGSRWAYSNYGFLLLGMDRIRHPQAGALARRTLDLLDPTGAWVEYYADGKPQGTRCRPWESAINCLAILRHLRGKKIINENRNSLACGDPGTNLS